MQKILVLILLLCLFGATIFAQEEEDFSLPISEDVNYTVRPADTLDGIGAIFDVSPTCIAETNDITNVREVFVGDVLLISVACPLYGADPRDNVVQEVVIPRTVVTFEDECEGYRVRRNDSIDLIGFNLDVSAVAIAQANELTPPYVLEVNQCLIIPEGAPVYGVYPPLQTVDGQPIGEDIGVGGAGTFYVIQPGDTLDEVALELNVSLQAIIFANNISDTKSLTAGTVVFITADMPPYGVYPVTTRIISGQAYLIREGDTIESIAQTFDVAVIALQSANEISIDEDLVVGDGLIIPDNAPAFGEDEGFDPLTLLGQGGGGSETHVVQPMETIDGIAALYGISRQCLLETNGITRPNLTQPGTLLVIDETCPAYVGEGIPPLDSAVEPAGS